MSWISDLAHRVSDSLNRFNPDPGQYDDVPISDRPSAFKFEVLPPEGPARETAAQSPGGVDWRDPGYVFPHQQPGHERQYQPPEEWDDDLGIFVPAWEQTQPPTPGSAINPADIGFGPDSPYTTEDGGAFNPHALYYAPDQYVDAESVRLGDPRVSGGIPDYGGFRGVQQRQMAHGFRPDPLPMPTPSGGRGGAAGAPARDPFSFAWDRPQTPGFQRPEQFQMDMTDPMPPGEAPERPEPFERDTKRYEKLLGR